MCVAMSTFTFSDAISKGISEFMNVGQYMVVRGLFAVPMIVAHGWWRGALRPPRDILHPMILLRVAGEAGGTMFFLLALTKLPLANVSAVMQALPLTVTLGAALIFGEPVGWRRWTAISVGFIGVMVIIRPGFEGFSPFALMVLLSVACCTVRDLATRNLPPEIPTLFVSTVTATVVLVLGFVMVWPLGGWAPMRASHVGWTFAAAVFLSIGYQFIIMAMREGEISLIAPFRYTALVWAMLIGVLVFSEELDLPMIAGASLVVGSGLYTLYRERFRSRSLPAASSTGPGMAPDGT